jgi:hypothetical protein
LDNGYQLPAASRQHDEKTKARSWSLEPLAASWKLVAELVLAGSWQLEAGSRYLNLLAGSWRLEAGSCNP